MSGLGDIRGFARKAAASKQLRALILLVAGISCSLLVGNAVYRVVDSPVAGAAVVSVGDFVSGSAGDSFPDGLWQSVVAGESDEIPALFESELLDLSGKKAWVSSGGDLVGFWCSAASDEAMVLVSDELAGKGWVKVESGTACIASFVKEQGAYRWCYLVCQGDDESSCVSVMFR